MSCKRRCVANDRDSRCKVPRADEPPQRTANAFLSLCEDWIMMLPHHESLMNLVRHSMASGESVFGEACRHDDAERVDAMRAHSVRMCLRATCWGIVGREVIGRALSRGTCFTDVERVSILKNLRLYIEDWHQGLLAWIDNELLAMHRPQAIQIGSRSWMVALQALKLHRVAMTAHPDEARSAWIDAWAVELGEGHPAINIMKRVCEQGPDEERYFQ